MKKKGGGAGRKDQIRAIKTARLTAPVVRELKSKYFQVASCSEA